jgi:hypothetical protein
MNRLWLIAFAAALLLGAGALTWHVRDPGFSVKTSDRALSTGERLEFRVTGADRIDLRDATGRWHETARVRDGIASVDVSDLDEGSHLLRVRSGADSASVRVRVDLTPPGLDVPARVVITEDLVVRTEPGAKVTVGDSSAVADARGRATLTNLESQKARILASDEAGNETSRQLEIVVDTGPPRLGNEPGVSRTAHVRLAVDIEDESRLRVIARIDGQEAVWKDGVVIGPLAHEGTHVLDLVATDEASRTLRRHLTFLVDSSERLGDNSLGAGARGKDVLALQRQLKVTGPERASMTYGPRTREAVMNFQQSAGLPADGIAGPMTLAALTSRIVIDRSAHTLRLFRYGRLVRSYGVAVGSASHPTPAGSYVIVSKIENPTWNPPDSDWAQGLSPVPPGPDNPLGTRWMGLSAPSIGIHGTNSPASIGYSVSHGCIRMKIPDAEDLFERVQIGTRVQIV